MIIIVIITFLLLQSFSEFGEVRVEWPGRDYTSPPKGYLYLVFHDEEDVKSLLAKCSQDSHTRDSYYYKIASRRSRSKDKVCPQISSIQQTSLFILRSRKSRSFPGSSRTPTTSGAAPQGWILRRRCSSELCTA